MDEGDELSGSVTGADVYPVQRQKFTIFPTLQAVKPSSRAHPDRMPVNKQVRGEVIAQGMDILPLVANARPFSFVRMGPAPPSG